MICQTLCAPPLGLPAKTVRQSAPQVFFIKKSLFLVAFLIWLPLPIIQSCSQTTSINRSFVSYSG
jgi:hypothetical protein